jgi:hypothetical protein
MQLRGWELMGCFVCVGVCLLTVPSRSCKLTPVSVPPFSKDGRC